MAECKAQRPELKCALRLLPAVTAEADILMYLVEAVPQRPLPLKSAGCRGTALNPYAPVKAEDSLCFKLCHNSSLISFCMNIIPRLRPIIHSGLRYGKDRKNFSPAIAKAGKV